MIQNPNVRLINPPATIEKEGMILNGTAEEQLVFTYEGDYRYLDIDCSLTSSAGGIIIRDNSDYSHNTPDLVHILDKDTGAEYGATLPVGNPLRDYHIRIDAKNALDVKLFVLASTAGKICVSKIFTDESKGDEVKFTKLATTSSASITIINKEAPHKAYMVVKATTSSSAGDLVIFDGDSTTSLGNKPDVYSSRGYINNRILLNYEGTRYFLVDVSKLSRVNTYINSASASKITDCSAFYTDDYELACQIAGITPEIKMLDIVENGVVTQYTFMYPLTSARWYVVYLDFISGNIKTSESHILMNAFNAPVYRYDMLSTGTYAFNFTLAGELKSGYYFIDCKNATPSLTNRISFTPNIQDLSVRVTHIGMYDDISGFVSGQEMAINDDRFQLKYLGHTIHYALDDFWVSNGDIITLGSNDGVIKLTLSNFNWRKFQSGREKDNRITRLLHPQYASEDGEKKTSLMVHIFNDDNSGAEEWWVCDVSDIQDALTKSNWQKVKFWEKKGTARKIPTKDSSEADANHRYDTTLPDSYYNYNEVSTDGYHIAFQGVPDLYSLRGFGAHGKKLTVFGQYSTTGERICLWVSSDGGFNFVAVYDFVGLGANADEDINTSSFTNYSSGLTLSKVTRNIPTAANKEPDKYTITELSGWTLVKGTSTTITFSDAHGLRNNDIVAFTGSSTSEWNQLKTSELTSSSIGDNVYFVKVDSNTQITLKPFRGSYDTQLQCRHIHSVNETKSGFIFATGEAYPLGWTMFLEQKKKDASETMDAMSENFKVYRLNSSENSLQRACGVLMFEDESDPTIIFNSDDSNVVTNMQWTIEGRTNLPMSSSNGIWKGKLSDIDDYSKFECIADIPDPAIWMFRYNGIIVGYYQLGGIAVSVDDGKSFRYYPYYDGLRLLVGVYKGKIVMNQGYALELK